MTKKSKLSILIMASLLVATIIILLISKGFFTKPKNTIKSDIKKVGDKSYYQIEIESPEDFTAIISTQAKAGIIEDSINLIHYDSLQKQLRNWNIKISKKLCGIHRGHSVHIFPEITITQQNGCNCCGIDGFTCARSCTSLNALIDLIFVSNSIIWF